MIVALVVTGLLAIGFIMWLAKIAGADLSTRVYWERRNIND